MENANIIDEALKSSCVTWQFFQKFIEKAKNFFKLIMQCMDCSTSCQSFQEFSSEIHVLANNKAGNHMGSIISLKIPPNFNHCAHNVTYQGTSRN